MSRTSDLITELCPSGVEFKTLGEVGTFIRGNGLQKSDLIDVGFPAIHYGQIHTFYDTWATQTKSFVAPAIAERFRRAKPGDLVVATTSEDDEAVGKAVAWLGDREAAVSGDAYIYRHSLEPKYVSYFFQSEQFRIQKKRSITGTKVRRISGDKLAKIKIPIPPLNVQREIIRILDLFKKLEGELEAELDARERQYAHYSEQLLTFPKTGGVRWATMGEVLDMRAGRFVAASKISAIQDDEHPFACYGGNGVRGYVEESSQEGTYALIGRQGALCGNVKRACGQFYATEHAVVVTPDSSLNSDWVFYMLAFMNLNQYATKSAQPGLAVGTLERVPFPVPPLKEQERIVEILDKFYALVNDLNVGLPAELSARRRQYEYYRDHLLTFQEKVK